jgi:hypothetical protein
MSIPKKRIRECDESPLTRAIASPTAQSFTEAEGAGVGWGGECGKKKKGKKGSFGMDGEEPDE